MKHIYRTAERRKQRIAEIVDTWYLEWKVQFPSVVHPLGIAKEELKSELFTWADMEEKVRELENMYQLEHEMIEGGMNHERGKPIL